MAYTTPRTWVDGEVVTAAIGNVHWRDNIAYCRDMGNVYLAGWIPDAAGLAAGTTRYMGSRGHSATETSSQDRLPSACTATSLYCLSDGPAGGGETITFTVRKNQVDTALTTSISGGSDIIAHALASVTFTAGDLISVKVVASGGAGTRLVNCGVKLN